MAEKKHPSAEKLSTTLTEEQYRVTQEAGTEAPFSGAYHACKKDGDYHCVCCGARLFTDRHKYDSGTGWPSFWAPDTESAIVTRRDASRGMIREEVSCAECGAHLGHVFDDGPKPSGLRFCINSASLDFAAASED